MVPRSVRRAALVATPTEFVRGTVLDAFDIAADRVVVVPHGVDRDLGADATDEGSLRARYGLGERRVVVHPAITHPHKGHLFLLEVLARAWRDPDLVLVLLGGQGAAEAEVAGAIRRLGLGGRVVRPGRVPAADRDGLVALAEALVFPSRYEGFGAPVVEAMRLGTPVVCSDHPALAEVVGGAGLVVPLELDEWAGALERVAGQRADLVDAGRRRADHFTTRIAGRALASAYARAAA
jgi:alpha-1,3-rhamnosyl/mannosyltransferase